MFSEPSHNITCGSNTPYHTHTNNSLLLLFLGGSPGRFTCPKRQVALTSPENGLATFQLKLRDQDHILMLPAGRHPYIIKSADQMCNVTLDAEGTSK